MASGKFIAAKTVTKIVETSPAKYVLELNEREALVIQALVANAKSNVFPEVRGIYGLLSSMGLDYYGKIAMDKTFVRHITLVDKGINVGN